MLFVPSPIVLVIVLAIDFCPLESDKRNVFKAADNPMIKPKIDKRSRAETERGALGCR